MANDFSDAWCERHPGAMQELEAMTSQPNACERIAAFMEQMYWCVVVVFIDPSWLLHRRLHACRCVYITACITCAMR